MGELHVAVILRYGLDPTPWRARYDRGEVCDETPYAYHLASSTFALEWSKDHAEGRVGRLWRTAVRKVLGFDMVHVWRNRGVIARADAVWTHTEREHLAVAVLKGFWPQQYRARTIAQSVWLWDEWPTLSWARRRSFAWLLRRHDNEVVLSRVNRDVSRAAVTGRTVVRVPFGTHFAQPGDAASASHAPRVLVVGNDRHRDWPLMLEVTRRLRHLDFDVVSLSAEVKALPWPSNVRLHATSQREILSNAYRHSSVVALPLRPNRHASGCTVAIEAISAGVPVVASDAGGIDEYLEGTGAALVAVDDRAGFVRALEASVGRTTDPGVAARRGMSESDYVARLVSLTRATVAGTPVPSDVESFERMLAPAAASSEPSARVTT